MNTGEVKVWDLFVRIFHWTLVVVFTIAYLTGDDAGRVHEWSGYAVLALVGARILWGFVGTRYARFADFVYGPSMILRYSVSLLTGHPTRYLGHNPLGGLMVMALLVLLLLSSVTGILALEPGMKVSTSPVATAQANDDDRERHESREYKREEDSLAEELHEAVSEATLFLVVLHILGVLIGSWRHGENLIAAMFTGRKRTNPP